MRNPRFFRVCTPSRSILKYTFFATLLCFCTGATKSAIAQIQIPAIGNINTVAGDGTQGYAGDGGQATSAELNLYIGNTALDSSGNLYIVDEENFVIREVSAATGVISTVVGSGCDTSIWMGEGQSATSIYYACFNQLTGVGVDASGNIYIEDAGLSKIFKVTASTGIITTVAGNGSNSVSGDGGQAISAGIGVPYGGVALDSAGNLYFADAANNRVRKVVLSTGIITTAAGSGPNGQGGFSGDGGPATSARLSQPVGVAVDSSGNIYIADGNNNRVRMVAASTGFISTVAGSGGSGYQNAAYSGDGGLATNARFYYPSGVAVDQVGDIYIADDGNNVIREVISSTGIVKTVAGNGTSGYTGDNGVATSAELNAESVSLDAAGNVYIFDLVDDVIRVLGTAPSATAVVDPLYKVVSVVYAAPGNKSSAGYTSSLTNGSTTTVGSSFSNTSSITFTEGFQALLIDDSVSESFGVSSTSGSSMAFQETFTDATSVSNMSNTGNPNTVNHGNDEILIWLNPELSILMYGTTPAAYNVGTQTTNGQAQPPDILEITASTMQDNGSGQTTVDPGYLIPQTLPSPTNGTQVTLPGLANVCKNLNKQEYLNKACTLADQCGCLPSDFTDILSTDPLLNYNGTGPYPGTVSPLEADVSGASNCQSPTPSLDCRYVPVPIAKGSSQIAFQTLQGPQCSTCNSSPNGFTQTDATTTTQTLSSQLSDIVGASIKVGAAGFYLTFSDTMTWVESKSTGTANGSGNSQTVTLNSSTVGCVEDILIYEDTVYHTFVFQEPTPNNLCP